MKKNVFIFIILLFGSIKSFSQISVTSYSIYAFGINTSKEKKINVELKSFLVVI